MLEIQYFIMHACIMFIDSAGTSNSFVCIVCSKLANRPLPWDC